MPYNVNIAICRIQAADLDDNDSVIYKVIEDIKNGDHAIITGTTGAHAYLSHIYNLKAGKAYQIVKGIPTHETLINIVRPEHDAEIRRIIRNAIITNATEIV
jgi:hypothetical protein